MEYYTRLKNARIDSDLTQTQVAEIIGTKQQQIYKYENGLQSMTIERLKELCILYKVSADYILGIERREKSRLQSKTNCTKYTFLYIKSGTQLLQQKCTTFCRLEVLHNRQTDIEK